MIRRTIPEEGRIKYGSEDNNIPESQAKQIVAKAKSAFGKGVLELGYKELRARGVVGVVATPGCQIEILPKIEGRGESDAKNATLRARLIHMLAVAYDLPIEAGAITQLGSQRDTVLEQLIRLFCDRLTDAVRQGMPRHYLEHEDDLPALRGRLDVTRQFSTLAVTPQKLACRFDALSPNIALNQVMRAAVNKLSRLTAAPDNQRALRKLGFVYADVADVPPKALRWDRIVLDRTNRGWRDLCSLARLLLSDRHQRTSAEVRGIDGLALLFKMNDLFEKYVARILKQALVGTDYHVLPQRGGKYCLYEGDKGRFQTRPDLIIRQGKEIKLIVDTKWKPLSTGDPKRDVNQPDVYQLMAYSRLYDDTNVMLLYPHHRKLPPDLIQPGLIQRYSIAEKRAPKQLIVATLDLAGTQRDHRKALEKLALKCLGSPGSGQQTSNADRPGRTDTAKASTGE